MNPFERALDQRLCNRAEIVKFKQLVGPRLMLNSFFLFFLSCLFLCRKSKEEYDEEMSRRLLLEKEVGSTSSGCSSKLMAECDEAKNTSSALSQHISPAKVRHHEHYELNKTCEPAK